MEVGKGACILIILVFVYITHEIAGQEKFILDFLRHFNIDNTLFISTDTFDEDFSNIRINSTTAFIRYTSGKDEDEVAGHLNRSLHQMCLYL